MTKLSIKCNDCGTQIAFMKKEIKKKLVEKKGKIIEENDRYSGDGLVYYKKKANNDRYGTFLICPVCSSEVWFKVDKEDYQELEFHQVSAYVDIKRVDGVELWNKNKCRWSGQF